MSSSGRCGVQIASDTHLIPGCADWRHDYVTDAEAVSKCLYMFHMFKYLRNRAGTNDLSSMQENGCHTPHKRIRQVQREAQQQLCACPKGFMPASYTLLVNSSTTARAYMHNPFQRQLLSHMQAAPASQPRRRAGRCSTSWVCNPCSGAGGRT